jgi:hypothetical protein
MAALLWSFTLRLGRVHACRRWGGIGMAQANSNHAV